MVEDFARVSTRYYSAVTARWGIKMTEGGSEWLALSAFYEWNDDNANLLPWEPSRSSSFTTAYWWCWLYREDAVVDHHSQVNVVWWWFVRLKKNEKKSMNERSRVNFNSFMEDRDNILLFHSYTHSFTETKRQEWVVSLGPSFVWRLYLDQIAVLLVYLNRNGCGDTYSFSVHLRFLFVFLFLALWISARLRKSMVFSHSSFWPSSLLVKMKKRQVRAEDGDFVNVM